MLVYYAFVENRYKIHTFGDVSLARGEPGAGAKARGFAFPFIGA